MRILFLASYFPRPSKPQIGTWALQQAKALSRQADVRVVCCTSYVPKVLGIVRRARPWTIMPASHRWDDVDARYLKTLYYPISPFKKWAHAAPQGQMSIAWRSVGKRLLAMVDEFQPDVLFCHHSAVNGYFAKRLYEKRNVPYIITDHDFAEIADCEKFPRRRAFFEPILQSAFRNVCVARRMEEDMKRIFPFARTQVIHNGINPHRASIFSTPRPAELEGKLVLFSAGMFVPRKGFPLLIEAFSKIASRHPAAMLRIGGDGPDRGLIEAAIARFGMADRVKLLGLLPQERIFQEMAWCDVFPLISWNEPFATVFIEAMGAGKPIVTASDGGINDVVKDHVHGMVVPPKDCSGAAEALDFLLANGDARTEMGRNAKRLVEEHLTWDANSQTMWDIFAEAARE